MSDQRLSELTGGRPDETRPGGSAVDGAGRVVWGAGEFEDETWRQSAACRDFGSATFFPVGFTGAAIPQIAHAKAICQDCPVRLACLQYSLVTNQEYGVWGGYDEEERRSLRRKWRRLGRPAHFVPGVSTERVGPIDHTGSDQAPEAS